MDYNIFFDTLFSSPYIYYGVWLLILAAIMYLIRKWDTIWMGVVFTAILISSAMIYGQVNTIFFLYGKPDGIDYVILQNEKLYVIDYVTWSSGGGKFSGYSSATTYRVNVLDLKTGDKIKRFQIGPGGGKCRFAGDSVIKSFYKSVEVYSLSTGKLLCDWNTDSLQSKFPELSSGIGEVKMLDKFFNYQIETNGGGTWIYNFKTKKLSKDYVEPITQLEKIPTHYISSNKIYLSERGEIRIDNKYKGTLLLGLGREHYGNGIKYLIDKNDSIINKEIKFKEPQIVAINAEQNCFIVKSLTSDNSYVYTGISLDGKEKRWELKQSTINANEEKRVSARGNWDQWDIYYLNDNIQVFAMQIASGEIVWRQKL